MGEICGRFGGATRSSAPWGGVGEIMGRYAGDVREMCGRCAGYMGRCAGDVREIRPDLDVDADAAGARVLDNDRHALAVRRELEDIEQQPALGPRRVRHLDLQLRRSALGEAYPEECGGAAERLVRVRIRARARVRVRVRFRVRVRVRFRVNRRRARRPELP